MSDELPKFKMPSFNELKKQVNPIIPVGDFAVPEALANFIKPVVKKPPKKGEVKKEIWKVTSFYLSEGQTWPQIVADAKEVASLSNVERTITVAHKHFLGQNCTKTCRSY